MGKAGSFRLPGDLNLALRRPSVTGSVLCSSVSTGITRWPVWTRPPCPAALQRPRRTRPGLSAGHRTAGWCGHPAATERGLVRLCRFCPRSEKRALGSGAQPVPAVPAAPGGAGAPGDSHVLGGVPRGKCRIQRQVGRCVHLRRNTAGRASRHAANGKNKVARVTACGARMFPAGS